MKKSYLERILKARVYDVAVETPLEPARALSGRLGNRLLLKREDLQPIFSFKLRGAYNKMASLPAARLKKGVIAASASYEPAPDGRMATGPLMIAFPPDMVAPGTDSPVKSNRLFMYAYTSAISFGFCSRWNASHFSNGIGIVGLLNEPPSLPPYRQRSNGVRTPYPPGGYCGGPTRIPPGSGIRCS